MNLFDTASEREFKSVNFQQTTDYCRFAVDSLLNVIQMEFLQI